MRGVAWVTGNSEDECIGLIGNGLRITLLRSPRGWSVTFGAVTLPRYYDLELAKWNGIALAKQVLTECLITLYD